MQLIKWNNKFELNSSLHLNSKDENQIVIELIIGVTLVLLDE